MLFPSWIATATLLFGALFVWRALVNVADGSFGAGDLWVLAPFALLTGVYLELRDRFPSRARHLQLSASPEEVARGGAIRVLLTIDADEPLRVEVLELGLVCVERYDEAARRGEMRWWPWPLTREEVVYEEWHDVDAKSARHELRFAIPRHPPFSYEGTHVSYTWRLRARGLDRRRRDRFADHPIWVLP